MDRLQARLSSASSERIHVSFVQVFLERCDARDEPRQELHVSLRVFDSSPALPSFRLFEARQLQSPDPVGATGKSVSTSIFRFAPRVGFNSSDRAFGGGKFIANFARGPFNSMSAEGTGSQKGSRASLDLSGERAWETGLFQSASWHLGFLRSDRPTGIANLIGSSIYGQAQLISQPMGISNTMIRFASEIAGGVAQSSLQQTLLPLNTLTSAENDTLKNAIGITTRLGSHSLAASYGVQLGRVGRKNVVDYHKQLVDVAYSTYKVSGDHRLVEYETRFSFGTLGIPGLVPAAERFFGGNRESSFFSGAEFSNDWRIRSNPYLRGFAANQFNRVVPGPVTGSERFTSWSNTISLPLPLVNYPLLPQKLIESDDFKQGLKKQRSSNESALVVSYTADDPASKEAARKIPLVDASLETARRIVETIAATGGAAVPEAQACSIVIRDRQATLAEAGEAMQIVVDVTDESAVIPPVIACVGDVQKLHPDQRLDLPLSELRAEMADIVQLLQKINSGRIDSLVGRDMALTDRVMNTFFKEASFVAVHPVLVFDAGRLTGPAPSSDQLGLRFSVGGGLRLQFIRVLNVTGGYAANPRRRPGEHSGAFFFSMDFLDLFR